MRWLLLLVVVNGCAARQRTDTTLTKPIVGNYAPQKEGEAPPPKHVNSWAAGLSAFGASRNEAKRCSRDSDCDADSVCAIDRNANGGRCFKRANP